MNNPSTSAEEKLAALRERFALSLPSRLDAIEAALDGDLPELERLLHNLAGTAATFGFHAIAGIARRGERHCAMPGVARAALAELRAEACQKPDDAFPSGEVLPNPTPSPARILCLEDDPDQAAYVCAVLQSANYETLVAADLAEFARVLDQFRPDLLLLDINLPDGNGLELAATLRGAGTHAALPIVLLGGRGSMRARVDGLRAGGDDYIVKPVPRDLLLATVAARLERARSVRSLFDLDPLTLGLTRAAFLRAMKAAAEDHACTGMPYCLVMLDLDHFKSINDGYGHPTGDRVLSLFGRFLRANVRREDVIGRLGGEEFGVLFAGMGPNDARGFVERLLDCFGRIPHPAPAGKRFHVTFSAGVATLGDEHDLEAWRQRADDALYAAKRAGRARVAAA